MSPGALKDQSWSPSPDSGSNFSYTPVDAETPGISTDALEANLAQIAGLEPIAIVGMGCRLPGDVSSPAAFWKLMMEKGTGQTPRVPSSRFNIDAHFHPNNERPGSFNVLGGYFLDSGLQEFDPAPFGISPVEAMWMDPQQRKLLEVVYEAFENGGIDLEKISGTTTACFVGSFTSDFQQMSFKEPDYRHSYAATGVDPGLISNRISHVFNLHGPSITVNTACSSSVYALHNACNALRNRECDGAVVGGVNLVLTVDQHMNTAKLGVLSPTSTCNTFNEFADGYGRADGVGAVYIKRLDDALKNGDPIRAVIRSSAVNSNGKAPAVGITHPNLQGQVDVIKAAYGRAGLDPNLTGYFECHGTGTPVGDPLEVHAVAKAMTVERQSHEPLWIGAVKTNIGHSEAASGLSAVIKATLAVENGVIPPTRGVKTLNSKIQWDDWQVKVVTEPTTFPSSLPVRRVSINSFGYGGTNGHVVIDNVESVIPGYKYHRSILNTKPVSEIISRNGIEQPHLLVFSAYDKVALRSNIDAHAKIAAKAGLHDLAYTLATRRSKLSHRSFAVCRKSSLEGGFEAALQTVVEGKKSTTIAFAFTGQGAQWPRMGAELIRTYPSIARTIDALDEVLQQLAEPPAWFIRDLLLEPSETSRVNEAEYSQPLCTAVQVALIDLLAEWKVTPVATVGHSSGEIAAAYASGYISAQDAIVAAYFRGKVVGSVRTAGAMLAVGLGAEEIGPYLGSCEGKVVIACHNSPNSTTLSGDVKAIMEIKETLDAENVFARVLKTNGKAYHSHHMESVSQIYETHMKQASQTMSKDTPRGNKIPMISSVTGYPMGKRVIGATYWSANLISPVLFNQALYAMVTEIPSIDMVVEIGPHSALSGPIRQIFKANNLNKIAYSPTLLRGLDDAEQMLKLAGGLWAKGAPIDLARVVAVTHLLPDGQIVEKQGALLVDLPTYRWNYSKNLWAEPRQSREHRAPQFPRHDILGSKLPGLSHAEPLWRNILRPKDVPWLKHHMLGGEIVFPAAGYFSMAMEALTQINSSSETPVSIDSYTLRDVIIKNALVIPDDDDGIESMLGLQPSVFGLATDADNVSGRWYDFNVSSYSAADKRWNNHMSGTIAVNMRKRGQSPAKPPPMHSRASGKSWNQRLRSVGFDYGATFQDMSDVRSDGKAFAAVARTVLKQDCNTMQGESRHIIHPATVDSCLQLIIVSIYAGRLDDVTCGAVPVQVDEVSIWVPQPHQLAEREARAYARTSQRGNRSFITHTQLVAQDEELLMDVSNMRCVAYEAAVPQTAHSSTPRQPYMRVEWKADIDLLQSPREVDDSSQPTLESLLGLMAHKKASMKVLHLDGAKSVIESFKAHTTLDYTLATKTDEELEVLKGTWKDHANVNVIKLDVTAGSADQDGKPTEYDLIIASEIDICSLSSLKNVRGFLAPGGRLLLQGPAKIEPSSSMLAAAGFATPESRFQNLQTGTSLLIAGALPSQQPAEAVHQSSAVLLVHQGQPTPVLSLVAESFTNRGVDVRIESLESVEHHANEQVILLADLEKPLLASLQEYEFKALQSLITSTSRLLWVTCGTLLSGNVPEHAMTSGFARSLTSEDVSLDLITLDSNPGTTTDQRLAEIIVEVAEHQATDEGTGEKEYLVDHGIVHISRVTPNDTLNKKFINTDEASLIQLNEVSTLEGCVQAGKVVFREDDRLQTPLDGDHVEIRALYVGLNKEDAMVVNSSDYPTTFSHEIAGVVTAIGQDVEHLKIGNRVVGFAFNRFATYQRTPATLVKKLRETDSLETMVTLPMSFAPAVHGLINLAGVETEDVVLVLSGTGTAGLAAIQICQAIKARVLVVASDDDSITLLRSLGVPLECIISAEGDAVPAEASRLTNGRGVDVVFSCGTSDANTARECWRSIGPFGRFVDFGRKNLLSRRVLDTVPLNRGASFFSFDILHIFEEKPTVLAKILEQCMELYNQRQIKAIKPTAVRQISELDDALHSFSDSFSAGKVVISYESKDSLVKVLPSRTLLRFRPDATYLLVGCLGGLGRSLTSWMIERGVKHLAFMSRSGADSPSAAALISTIEDRGVKTTILRGDVTIQSDVEAAIRNIDTAFPIRGVVHAAMVLDDGMFRTAKLSSFETAVKPKVHGARNLHRALQSTPLDFFVMTSSTSGTLGTPGQSNYAAGNAYLDALATHRRARGLSAVSLVLPMVLGVGYVAEHPEVEAALRRKGIYGIDEAELLDAFEAAMGPAPSASDASAQIIVGLDPARLAESLAHEDTTDAFWTDDARFRTLIAQSKAASQGDANRNGSGDSVLAALKAAPTTQAAVAVVVEALAQRLARLLMIDLAGIEAEVGSVASYGLDSMIGTELRNWLFREFAVDVPFQQLLGAKLTVAKLAANLCAEHGRVEV